MELCKKIQNTDTSVNIQIEEVNSFDQYSLEFLSASVFHYYCQIIENDIRGYQHVEWLWEQIEGGKFLDTFKFRAISLRIIPDVVGIENTITEFLAESDDAFVMFFTTMNNGVGHSRLLCKFNNLLYVGDPNDNKFYKNEIYNNICKTRDYDGFYEDCNNNITECIFVEPNNKL